MSGKLIYALSPQQYSNVAMDPSLLSSNVSLIEERNIARSWVEPERKKRSQCPIFREEIYLLPCAANPMCRALRDGIVGN